MSTITRLEGYVTKGWGYENIIITNELYCAKFLHFTKAGNKFSMHFHAEKDETWYVTKGLFKLRLIDTRTGNVSEVLLQKGDSIRIFPLTVHQLVSLEDNSEILEVSTPDCVEDNYRVAPGDSQSA